MKYISITDNKFSKYGQVLDIDTSEIIKEAEKIKMPEEGSIYTASVLEFEKLDIAKTIQDKYYGEAEIQLGYCYGHSNFLNALEWHKCSEINIAVTDMVLLFGTVFEFDNDGKYNSENTTPVLLKKGQAIEVYSTTLHFCPCETSKNGFGCIVGLTKGTNLPLECVAADKRIFRKNKWLIAHEENSALVEKGVVPAIYGKNIEVKY